MIYLSYYYDFELQGRLGGEQKFSPNPNNNNSGVLLDLSGIAAGKNKEDTKGKKHFCAREVALI